MKKRRKQGRPPLFTQAVQKRLVRMIEEGSTLAGATAICGCSSRILREWMQKGENGDPKFAELFSAVSRAREAAKDRIARSLLTERDWRARAFWLAKIDPQQWGDEPRVVVVEREAPRGIAPTTTKVEWLQTEIPFSREQLDWLATIQTRMPSSDNANANGSDRI